MSSSIYSQKQSSAEDKVLIRQQYDDMYRFMIAKDTASLGRLFDDDFVLMHMTGMCQPKQENLRCIADGTLNYFSCTDTHTDIIVHGNKAKMIAQSRVNAAVFGGGRHTWSLQLDIDVEKKDGRWLMKKAVASTY